MSHISHFEDQLRQDHPQDPHAHLPLYHATPLLPLALTPAGQRGRGRARGRLNASVFDFSNRSLRRGTPLTGGRFRPGSALSRQPYARRISFQPDFQAWNEEQDHKDNIQELCHQAWRVYRASPLFGMERSPAGLTALSQALQNRLGQHTFLARMSVMSGLRGTGDDAEALRLSVDTRGGGGRVVTALLLSVDNQSKLELTSASADNLPVLLLWAKEDALAKKVLRHLADCFDCVFSPISFSQSELKWMAAIWLDLDLEKDSAATQTTTTTTRAAALRKQKDDEAEPTVLYVFSLPEEIDPLRTTFEVKLKYKQVCSLWKSVHPSAETLATNIEVDVFHRALFTHIEKAMGLNLTHMIMDSFKMPIVEVDKYNKVQIRSSSHAKSILRFLTETCQLGLDSSCPRMGVQAADTMAL